VRLAISILVALALALAAAPPYRPPFGPWSRLHGGEPILTPQGRGFEAAGVFNPAVVRDGDRYVMLYRAQDARGTSRLGIASSRDAIHFVREPDPVLVPEDVYERGGGVEDPRLSKIGPTFYLTYTAYDGKDAQLALATSPDLRRWQRRGVIIPANTGRWNVKWTKAGAILEEPVNGRYWMYYMADAASGADQMGVAYSEDLLRWTEALTAPVLARRPGFFDSRVVEPGPAPLMTPDGILLVYNGADDQLVYRTGWVLFDRQDPTRVRARSDTPVFEPQRGWELQGQVPNVVFVEGLVREGQRWLFYYGGADKHVGVAEAFTRATPTAGGSAASGRSRIGDRIRGQAIAAALPPMEAPTVVPSARASHVRDEDVVLGVVVGRASRAYPWWIAKNFHVINDTVDGVPVAIAFCEQCTGAAAYRRDLDGRVLSIEVAGVYNGTIILRDRQTRTLWAPFSGKALEGPLAGRALERLPLSLTRWAEWKTRYPDAEVIWGPEQVRGGHGSWYEPGKWGIVGEMAATLPGWDPRLPENELVYGLEVPGGKRSYPLAELKSRGVVNDTVAEVPAALLVVGEFEVVAFDRRLSGRRLEFRSASGGGAVMVDLETQSTWSRQGVAVTGPLRGERLAPLEGYVVEWHVWAAYNPDTEIFGGIRPTGHDVAADVAFPSVLLVPVDGRAPEEVRFTGEVTLVALWTAWCAPCRAEMPLLQALLKEHAHRGLSVLGIAMHIPEDDAERHLVRRFLSEARITFPNRLVDERAYDQLESLLRKAGHPGLVLPTVLVIDKERGVRAVFRGGEVGELAEALPRFLRPTAGSSQNTP
jgi:predicted GH43/DUF377 family glycosyl hydrolase/thiol-disulfide isomerase/thioredoxin